MKKILIILTLNCIISMFGFAQYTGQTNNIYNAFKNNQFNFPPPPKLYDTVYVGEWDASISDPELSFTGIKGGDVEPGDGQRTIKHLPGLAYSFSYKYKLKFKVKNLQPGFRFYVKVNGTTYRPEENKPDIYIDVSNKRTFDWEIGNGVARYSDKLSIQKLPVVATGVFRVPLMPLLLVYEPPANNNMTNYTMYTRINTFGSSNTIGLLKDQNHTVTSSELTSIDFLKADLKLQSKILSNVPDAKAKVIGGIFSELSDDKYWGGTTSSSTNGVVKDKELTIISEDIQSSGISTDVNNGGPGIGNILKGIVNARFLWIIVDGKFSATLLDYQRPFSFTDKDIKDSIVMSANKNIYRALSVIDPFILNGPTYNLKSDPARYLYLREYGGDITGSSAMPYSLRHQFSQSERNTEIKYTIDIEDYKKGLLSYINLVPYDATESYKLEVRNKISNQVSTGTESIAELYIQSNEGEHRVYEVFWDNIYGTFAIQDPAKAKPLSPGGKKGQLNVPVKKTGTN